LRRRRRRRYSQREEEERAKSFAKKKKREKRQHATLCLGVAAKERKTNNKQQNVASSSLLTGVRDRRLSHLNKITVVITRTLVVLFLYASNAVVVVFYRAAKTMPRLHAARLGKKMLEYSSYSIARYTHAQRERRRRRRQ